MLEEELSVSVVSIFSGFECGKEESIDPIFSPRLCPMIGKTNKQSPSPSQTKNTHQAEC